MKEYLSKPGKRAFVESDSRAKPVFCVETGEYYPFQKEAEIATRFSGIPQGLFRQELHSRRISLAVCCKYTTDVVIL